MSRGNFFIFAFIVPFDENCQLRGIRYRLIARVRHGNRIICCHVNIITLNRRQYFTLTMFALLSQGVKARKCGSERKTGHGRHHTVLASLLTSHAHPNVYKGIRHPFLSPLALFPLLL